MNKNWTYKTKNLIALLVTILFLFIAYHFAIKKSIDLYFENNTIHLRLEQVKNAPKLIADYKTTLVNLNNQLGYIGSENKLSQDKILELVEGFCEKNNSFLTEYSKTILNTNKAFNIETNVIEIDGKYTDIVKLIYEIEYNKNISKVNAVYFIKEKNISTKRTRLTATIYLQNINIK